MVTTDKPHLRVVYLPVHEARRIQRLLGIRHRRVRVNRQARANALEIINWLDRLCGRKRQIEIVELKLSGNTWHRLATVLAECGAADLTAEIFRQIADVD